MTHRGAVMVVWQSAFKTEKPSHGAWLPPFTLPELAEGPRKSYRSECLVAEHIVCKPENLVLQKCFPLATGALCTHPSVRYRYTERLLRSASHHYRTAKQQRQQPASPAHPNPTHRSCITGSIWGQGIALGFGTPSTTTFLHGIGPLRLRGPEHRWHPPPQETQDIFRHSTEIWKARVVQAN